MAETGARGPELRASGASGGAGEGELGTRESAVLDEAHLGDIQGAFGTIREVDAEAGRSWKRKLLTLLAILGPGIIVMVGDNDAGGASTYAQAAQNYGLTLLWTLPLLVPVLIVNQEMVVRLGAVTGVGHARLINERFGKFWGAFSVGDLFVLNFLTITTEFIGVNLALGYFGVSVDVSVPIAAAAQVAITASGSFRRWERFMFIFIAANFLVIPLAVFSHPHASSFFRGFVVPGVHGGFTSTSMLLVIAIVGTTVAPWQLFFQQSNVVDKRITPRWISYERADTVIGSLVTVFAASLIMAVVAAAFSGHPLFGHYTSAEAVAHGLSRYVGHASGAIFSVVLLNASLIGAASVTLATSYAFGDVFGMRHSLPRSWREAKFFYATFTVMVIAAAAIVLVATGRLLGLITTGVQALAGVLLPSATVFLLLLCNDKEVLGPWVNRPWLNVIGFAIVSILLVLSLVLMVTTVFPNLDVRELALGMGAALVLVYAAAGTAYWKALRKRPPDPPMPRSRREHWRMPPLYRLERPVWSRGRLLAMYSLRGYLVLAVALLVVKAFQLGLHK